MDLERIVKMVGGGLMGYLVAPLLIPYSATYAYAAATRVITTVTGIYIGSSHCFSKKPA